jgi:hypothetical protein
LCGVAAGLHAISVKQLIQVILKMTGVKCTEAVDMNGRFRMQGGKNWFLPKEINANRFFWDSHWLEIWSNHFYPSMGPNGGSVAMDSVKAGSLKMNTVLEYSRRVVQEGGRRCKKSTLNDLVHLTNLRIPLMNPP